MTVVGLTPPVYHDGTILVDGGYVNNLPVDIMRLESGVGVVVACDVENKDNSAFTNVSPIGDTLSGWEVLLNRLNPLPSKRKIPTFSDIMGALTYAAHVRQIRWRAG